MEFETDLLALTELDAEGVDSGIAGAIVLEDGLGVGVCVGVLVTTLANENEFP